MKRKIEFNNKVKKKVFDSIDEHKQYYEFGREEEKANEIPGTGVSQRKAFDS